jgi:hypothetical protein
MVNAADPLRPYYGFSKLASMNKNEKQKNTKNLLLSLKLWLVVKEVIFVETDMNCAHP